MKLLHVARFAVTASVAVSSTSAQQAKVPPVPLGAIDAKGTEVLGAAVSIRALSNGAVLVMEAAKRRLLLFEPSLSTARVVMDSAALSNNPLAFTSTGLIPFAGDSTLFVDVTSQSLLVLDQTGKVARVMAVPKPQDIYLLGGGLANGAPGFDPKGRLTYRGQYRPPQVMPAMTPGAPVVLPVPPDSAPIVRADFDTRTVDTIASMKIPQMVKSQSMVMPTTPGAMPSSIKAVFNPAATGDEWAILTDGSIAIVRTQDYHIDWIDPDGKRRSTPKMPFDWRRATDADKQFGIDTIKRMIDSAIKAQPVLPNGQRQPIPELEFVPISEMPDYHPPIRPGSVRADMDGLLWILPTTSSDAKGGHLYDVVSHTGEVIHRVQLPANTTIVGFGKGGIVFLLTRDESGTGWVLARARTPFAKPSQN